MGRDVDREDARVCNLVYNKEEENCFGGGASLYYHSLFPILEATTPIIAKVHLNPNN